MICGYLPFDDDPNNPDGENIHLLYKYILETDVSFPDYVSEEAKDLLRGILNPDPDTRFTMEQIINHPWIREFKEFILIEYDENNEAIIPDCNVQENSKVVTDNNNMNNVKSLASQVFSSTSSSPHDSPMVTEDKVPDNEDNCDNDNNINNDDDDNHNEDDDDYFMDTQNVIPDISTIDSDQYIDFIKQSDCETVVSNNVNSEVSDFNPSIVGIGKQDSYYTAQSMDLNQNNSTVNDNGDDDDDDDDGELDIPLNIPMNASSNFGDSVAVPDSSVYYSDNFEIISKPSGSNISKDLSSSCESDEDDFLESSNKTVTDNKKSDIVQDEPKVEVILSESIKDNSSHICSSVLEKSLEENSSSSDKPKTAFNRISLQPPKSNNNLSVNPSEEEDKTSANQSLTLKSSTKKSVKNEDEEYPTIKRNKNEVEDEDQKEESQFITKLENLSFNTNNKEYQTQNQSQVKDENKSMISERKSIVSDRKSIRSRVDISQMNLDNIKMSRSNVSLSSRNRLSVCTTSTLGMQYVNPNKKRISSINNSFNDASVDSLHHIGHTSLIIPTSDVSAEMKRYSLNIYNPNRNVIRVPPNGSFVITNKPSGKSTSAYFTQGKSSRNENKTKSQIYVPGGSLLFSKKENDQILDELRDKSILDEEKVKLALDAIENDEDTSSNSSGSRRNSLKVKRRQRVEDITIPPGDVESRIEVDGEEAIVDKSRPGIVVVKTPGRELMSPKNPFIKYFNGIIDSKALTITPPFVTFLEIQKILIDMNVDYRVLNNCFKIRCQKMYKTINSPEDLEAIASQTPVTSPVHIATKAQSSSTANLNSKPNLKDKTAPASQSKKSLNEEVTVSSPKVKTSKTSTTTNDQVSSTKCYSFRSHGSGKLKSLMSSIIDCAKPSSSSSNVKTPSPLSRDGSNSEIHQKSLFSRIKRKKNQSLVIFTIEICRIKNRDELYIVKFKRQKGEEYLYTDLYQQIISKLPLRT